MSSFEEWWAVNRKTVQQIWPEDFAQAVWDARQPEIDALKGTIEELREELEATQELVGVVCRARLQRAEKVIEAAREVNAHCFMDHMGHRGFKTVGGVPQSIPASGRLAANKLHRALAAYDKEENPV